MGPPPPTDHTEGDGFININRSAIGDTSYDDNYYTTELDRIAKEKEAGSSKAPKQKKKVPIAERENWESEPLLPSVPPQLVWGAALALCTLAARLYLPH